MRASELPNLQNVSDISEFEQLFPEKIKRFLNSLADEKLEMPIVMKFPNGEYELIAGNTRLVGSKKNGIDPKVWVFELNAEDKPKKSETKESEITERCWKGYTQKGMKTMFGKRYPNCVKKTN